MSRTHKYQFLLLLQVGFTLGRPSCRVTDNRCYCLYGRVWIEKPSYCEGLADYNSKIVKAVLSTDLEPDMNASQAISKCFGSPKLEFDFTRWTPEYKETLYLCSILFIYSFFMSRNLGISGLGLAVGLCTKALDIKKTALIVLAITGFRTKQWVVLGCALLCFFMLC